MMAVGEDEKPNPSTADTLSSSSGVNESDRGQPFAEVIKHEHAVAEIAAGNAPDAHIFRIVRALANNEDPNPEDLDRLFDRSDSSREEL